METWELGLVLIAMLVATAGHAVAADAGALVSADFETDPLQAGWTGKPGKNATGAPAWADGAAHSGTHCLTAADGSWESPAFAVLRRAMTSSIDLTPGQILPSGSVRSKYPQ